MGTEPNVDKSSASFSLEEEIRQLRKEMHLAVEQEKSFTAERVLTYSRLLDEKLNAYFRLNRNSQ